MTPINNECYLCFGCIGAAGWGSFQNQPLGWRGIPVDHRNDP